MAFYNSHTGVSLIGRVVKIFLMADYIWL